MVSLKSTHWSAWAWKPKKLCPCNSTAHAFGQVRPQATWDHICLQRTVRNTASSQPVQRVIQPPYFGLNGRSSIGNSLACRGMPRAATCAALYKAYLCALHLGAFSCLIFHLYFSPGGFTKVPSSWKRFIFISASMEQTGTVPESGSPNSPSCPAYYFSGSSDISEMFSLITVIFLFHFPLGRIFLPRMRAENWFSLINYF